MILTPLRFRGRLAGSRGGNLPCGPTKEAIVPPRSKDLGSTLPEVESESPAQGLAGSILALYHTLERSVVHAWSKNAVQDCGNGLR